MCTSHMETSWFGFLYCMPHPQTHIIQNNIMQYPSISHIHIINTKLVLCTYICPYLWLYRAIESMFTMNGGYSESAFIIRWPILGMFSMWAGAGVSDRNVIFTHPTRLNLECIWEQCDQLLSVIGSNRVIRSNRPSSIQLDHAAHGKYADDSATTDFH